jgi:hypothetical protein
MKPNNTPTTLPTPTVGSKWIYNTPTGEEDILTIVTVRRSSVEYVSKLRSGPSLLVKFTATFRTFLNNCIPVT